jgi:hypothetical protein
LFGSVLALMAILIIWLIPSDAKTPILLTSRTNKEKTVVKLGNTSNTYNRSSSTSSMNITAATGLLSQEAGNHSTHDILSNSQELEPFLLNEMQTKSLLQSSTSQMAANSNASNNILMPSSLMSNTSSQANSDGTSTQTGSNNFLLNNSNYINEGKKKGSH